MPAIVGIVKVLNVGPSSIFHIGDSIQLAPQSTSKTFAGAGSFNTGDAVHTYNAINSTNTFDADVADTNAISANGAGVL
ncbi:spore germination protein [Paenibacillus ginsengarvi]|uniref:Spore germination protein n=1 Tax=Paenibacillus ginsengarvi TaxID=400777 RepID=A0A3B0CI30_9BACL|nr:spore germination protein [Paenibacillus ginsengarvi]RKN84244.1 spore germination protein [Paenibacillus ginsengarvi]